MDEYLITAVVPNSTLNPWLPKLIHQRLMVGLLVTAGEFRKQAVHVKNSGFVNPPFDQVPNLMTSFWDELNTHIVKGKIS